MTEQMESVMGGAVHSAQKLANSFTHLAASIGLGCWAYVSNQQISEEWLALAIADAREKLVRRSFRSKVVRNR
jgi:hypothetical protein